MKHLDVYQDINSCTRVVELETRTVHVSFDAMNDGDERKRVMRSLMFHRITEALVNQCDLKHINNDAIGHARAYKANVTVNIYGDVGVCVHSGEPLVMALCIKVASRFTKTSIFKGYIDLAGTMHDCYLQSEPMRSVIEETKKRVKAWPEYPAT